jgi:hypothetical protein
MRKGFLLSILIAVMVLFTANAHAEKYELGAGVAVKVDYFHFMDSTIRGLNAQDGYYVGVEAYKELLFPNFFLGMEVGWASTSGNFAGLVPGDNSFGIPSGMYALDTDINYIPIEFNAKYVYPLARNLKFGVGAGFSINHFDFSGQVPGYGSVSDNDWVWGGQFFGELNYKYENWFFGINVKYQITEDVRLFGFNTGVSADNLRVGGQIGITF